ncbi:MAG: HNH endonuclease signature motif containing protein [Candidatus Peregrinibacteria bacterium]|nr:HNH endonuclease signature motif containing protein [Candidatus Peregrinibacteria bacterium]
MNTTGRICISLEIESLSDSELYQKCKDFGLQTRIWKRKFAGLLPEVAKRELHKKRGFSSIYEFAGKLAGMSHEATGKILRIAIKVEDKPALKNLLISGDQGWSKIEKVAWVATKETDGKWAEKVKSMPQQALEVFVQEFRNNQESGQNPRINNDLTLKSKAAEQIESIANEGYGHFHENKWTTLSFAVSPETEFQLRYLKQAIEKERKITLTWNEFMEEVVKKCKTTNTKTSRNTNSKEVKKQKSEKTDETSRYIPEAIKKAIREKHEGRCAYPNCRNAGMILHHIKRFALNKNHNSESIVPICKKHELLAHTGEIINEDNQSDMWQTGNLLHKEELNKTLEGKNKLSIDSKVHMYRKE